MKDKYWGYVNTAVNTLDTINSLGGFADGAKGAKDVLSGGKTADKIMEEINIFYGRLDIDGEKSESSSASSISHGSTIESIGDISLTSRGDITQKGSDVYSHFGDISYTAGGDIDILAGTSTHKSSEDSTDVHFGAQFNFNPWAMANWSLDLEMSFQDSEADQSQTWHTNSTVQTQYGNVSMTSGEDLTVKGGNIYGNTVNIEAENLTIESIQDTSDSSSLSYGASTNITVGKSGVKGFGASANASWSESESAWVNQQSGIVSSGELTVSVKDKTELIGAVLGSETGEMTLETGSLEYRDIEDYDYSESYSIKTGQSWGTQPANQSDSTGKTPGSQGTSTEGGGLDKIDPSKGSNTLGGSIHGHDKEQLTKATIGEGTIIIKGEEQANESEALDGLNRDLESTQVITRDEETGGLDAEITVSNDWFTRPEDKLKNIIDLPENLWDASGALSEKAIEAASKVTGGIGLLLGVAVVEKTNDMQRRTDIAFKKIEERAKANIDSELKEMSTEEARAKGLLKPDGTVKTWTEMNPDEQTAYMNEKYDLYNQYKAEGNKDKMREIANTMLLTDDMKKYVDQTVKDIVSALATSLAFYELGENFSKLNQNGKVAFAQSMVDALEGVVGDITQLAVEQSFSIREFGDNTEAKYVDADGKILLNGYKVSVFETKNGLMAIVVHEVMHNQTANMTPSNSGEQAAQNSQNTFTNSDRLSPLEEGTLLTEQVSYYAEISFNNQKAELARSENVGAGRNYEVPLHYVDVNKYPEALNRPISNAQIGISSNRSNTFIGWIKSKFRGD
ncbi:hemagluttinin repeat-containing protein [Parelusimicrobium proximum]|uniref:hemagglutinin repeat-containing protein n=1 Tax=Parelusimicrobium proximum TaxID=3228953 RepID=UPI003D185AEF